MNCRPAHTLMLATFAACLLSAYSGAAPEMPASFGEPVDGLASRLVADRAVYEEGQYIFVYLDVFNARDKAVDVAWSYSFEPRLHITNEKGEEPQLRKSRAGDAIGHETVLPGKQADIMLFYVNGNQYARYDELPAGRYKAVWKREVETVNGMPLVPDSNIVTFEVVRKAAARAPVVPDSEVKEVPWGEEKHGLRTRIRAPHTRYYAGQDIPVVVEIQNASKQEINYHVPQVLINGCVEVLDGAGKAVNYLGGSAQTANPIRALKPGATAVLDEGSLSENYLLSRPGKYSARFPGARKWALPDDGFGGLRSGPEDSDIPPTNTFAFEVLPPTEQLDAGKKVTELLAANCPKGWQLSASEPVSNLSHPGLQWARVRCRRYCFAYYPPSGLIQDATSVNLWLAAEKAAEEPWQPREQRQTDHEETKYLGKSQYGHVYLTVPGDRVLKLWADPEKDLRKWLQVED